MRETHGHSIHRASITSRGKKHMPKLHEIFCTCTRDSGHGSIWWQYDASGLWNVDDVVFAMVRDACRLSDAN